MWKVTKDYKLALLNSGIFVVVQKRVDLDIISLNFYTGRGDFSLIRESFLLGIQFKLP